MRKFGLYIGFVWVALSGCATVRYQASEAVYQHYEIKGSTAGSNAVAALMKPYADSVNSTMNVVIGTLEAPLTKSWPSCSLGSFMTDAYLYQARKKYGTHVDFALMNVGGIRLNQMLPGPITNGKIYELMPFDNLMVLVTLTGKQVQMFLDHIASRGGWPISGGTYTIKAQKAAAITIGGGPLNPEKNYVLATSDYVANGGDESSVLRGLAQNSIGYLQRDALIEYVLDLTSRNLTITEPTPQRVIRN